MTGMESTPQRVEAAYQLLPPLTAEEYEALKADIAVRGVQVPVEYDERGEVLDGHHRVRACLELGISDWPRVVRAGMTEEEKVEHVLALNLHRRHLSRDQRRELVVTLRRQGWSLRRIAECLGVSHEQVRQDASGVKFLTPATVTGADGKQYPAVRPKLSAFVEDGALLNGPLPQPEPPRLPHVAYNSGENEWYTPPEIAAAARAALGGIDLDPASTAEANTVIQAARFYTAEDDGLARPWHGRVWLNPPYSQPLIEQFCRKLVAHVSDRTVTEACVLVNNATETTWFQLLASRARVICFPRGRLRFWAPGRETSAPLQGQAVLYLGTAEGARRFAEAFQEFGFLAWL